MAYDYAKSAANKWSQKKGFIAQHKSRIIILLLLAAACVFYRYSSIDFNQIKKGVSNTIVINQVRPRQLPKPKFEFYTRLPKGDISQQHEPMPHNTAGISQQHTPMPHNKAKKSLQNNVHVKHKPPSEIRMQAQHYLIQVGAFKKVTDADKLRAELIIQGHSASVSQFKNTTTTWYRVEIGPFSSLTYAKKQQQALESSHYNGLIKKIS